MIGTRTCAEYISEMRVFRSIFGCSYKRYSYARETIAILERISANTRYAIRYRYTRESDAIVERMRANARYAIRYRYTRETAAKEERFIANARYTIRYRYTRETSATVERSLANARYTSVGRNNTIFAPQNQSFSSCFNKAVSVTVIFGISAFYCYTRETAAIGERALANARYAIWYRYARDTTATIERPIANARYAIVENHIYTYTATISRKKRFPNSARAY